MTGVCGKDDGRRRLRAKQNATRRIVAGGIAMAGAAAMLAVPAAASASTGPAGAGARGSLAQPSGPTLESWGDNTDGQLDNGQAGDTSDVPGMAQLDPGVQLTQFPPAVITL